MIRQAGPAALLWVSAINLWEIATLYTLGRITLQLPLREWLEAATASPLAQRLGITLAVAATVAVLPVWFHRDPADRVILASAQVLGGTLLARDPRIIDAALVPTLA